MNFMEKLAASHMDEELFEQWMEQEKTARRSPRHVREARAARRASGAEPMPKQPRSRPSMEPKPIPPETKSRAKPKPDVLPRSARKASKVKAPTGVLSRIGQFAGKHKKKLMAAGALSALGGGYALGKKSKSA